MLCSFLFPVKKLFRIRQKVLVRRWRFFLFVILQLLHQVKRYRLQTWKKACCLERLLQKVLCIFEDYILLCFFRLVRFLLLLGRKIGVKA